MCSTLHSPWPNRAFTQLFRRYLKEFLIPYRINPVVYIINRDAISIPYKHLVYRAELSKDLFNFIEDPTLMAMGYPKWFYIAFPDVAMWAIKGLGNRIIHNEFDKLSEDELVDKSRKQFWEKNLRKVIDLYLANGNVLDCSIKN